MDARRRLPAISRLLGIDAVALLMARHGREPVVRAVRAAVAAARDGAARPDDDAGWSSAISAQLAAATRPTLQRCVNATGVVLHTNLGRAPLAARAIAAMQEVATGYSNLEYDLPRGARGERQRHCAGLLARLTGAEDALVVNNAASALVLAIAAAADGGEVVVSRGELVEIGGGFRIPDIMVLGGARLREVGTTNRTRLADYQKALKPGAALLKVHQSNFRVEGFTAQAGLGELVALGRTKRVPVLYDLGSGLMFDLDRAGLRGEPTFPAAVRSGAHAVIASGDKLLGGPQAGLIAGRKRFVAACRRHPFARAARADKFTLAALAATLSLYEAPERAWQEIPVLRMLGETIETLDRRAAALATQLPPAARAAVVTTRAAVGGGTFPGVTIESRAVAVSATAGADVLAARLRAAAVPVIGIVQAGRLLLDVRTLLPGDEALVQRAVTEALA